MITTVWVRSSVAVYTFTNLLPYVFSVRKWKICPAKLKGGGGGSEETRNRGREEGKEKQEKEKDE